jgi:hypothetical protein
MAICTFSKIGLNQAFYIKYRLAQKGSRTEEKEPPVVLKFTAERADRSTRHRLSF